MANMVPFVWQAAPLVWLTIWSICIYFERRLDKEKHLGQVTVEILQAMARPVWWCGYRSLWYHNYDLSPSWNSTLNINYKALKHHTGDWYSHSSMRIAKVSGAAYFIEIGVTIATQWRHFCVYLWWILLKSRSFLSKLSTVLVVWIVCLMFSEFLKQVLWERFRSILE